MSPTVQVDHLVYITPDVDATVDEFESRFGVRATPGGRHPAWATRNALLALGARTYLEILGVDEEALEPPRPRPFGLDALEEGRIVTWAAPHADLDHLVHEAERHKVDLGAVETRSRRQDDGTTLAWRMTDLRKSRCDGIIPFFVDWGTTPHPAAGAPAGCRLLDLRAEHPIAHEVAPLLATLGIALPVTVGARARLVARLETPLGGQELD